MNYLYIKDNKITSKGNFKNLTEGVINIEVSDEIYNNYKKYIYSNGEIVLNSEFEKNEEIALKERRIAEIKDELNKLDLKTIRALRANEEDKIKGFEIRVVELREEMAKIYAELQI